MTTRRPASCLSSLGTTLQRCSDTNSDLTLNHAHGTRLPRIGEHLGLTTGRPFVVSPSTNDGTIVRERGESLAPLRRLHLALLISAVIAGAAALAIQDVLVADRYMTDDAYISFRYARHFADGLGPVWSNGTTVEGYTNFGWILLLAGGIKLGIGPVVASRLFGLLASIGILALVPLLASQLRPAGSSGWWVATGGAIIALSLNTGFSLWTFAGLETSAFTLFVTAAVIAHLREERTRCESVTSALLLVVASLIRPDGVVILAVVAGAKVIHVLRRSRSRGSAVSLVVWTLSFAVPFGAFWLWRWSYYGDFFPNTYYLKSGSSRAFFERGAWYAWDFFRVYWIWLAFGMLASVWRERRSEYHPSLFCVALIGSWFAYVAAGGGDWMPYFRFFIPILPVLYVLTLHGLVDAAEMLATDLRPSRATSAAMGFAVAAVLVFSSIRPFGSAAAQNPSGFQTDPLPGAVNDGVHRAIGLWLKHNLPHDATVAQIATGIVPYYSDLPTLDMQGVNDHHIAHRHVNDFGKGSAGHDKQDGAYVVLSHPSVIWLSIGLEANPRRTPDDYKPPIDLRLAPVITDVTRNLYLWVFYRPVAIPFKGGWLNLLIRSDVTLGERGP